MEFEEASLYEKPFEYSKREIQQHREGKRGQTNEQWWQYERPRPDMRTAISNNHRYIATPRVAKHRAFVWVEQFILCNDGTTVFALSQDQEFGLLHSRPHEIWALGQGTQLRERESGFRYTPTTCFETFPFPEPTDAQRRAIAASARELDTLRYNWLNPPEWTRTEVLEFPGSTDGPWRRYIDSVDISLDSTELAEVREMNPHAEREGYTGGIGTVKYPRIVAKDAECEKELKKRTLTNLYNERPTWLDLAHKKLDEAVFAAYGWDPAMSDDELLAALLALNLERAAAE
jgi:hypothetical protein